MAVLRPWCVTAIACALLGPAASAHAQDSARPAPVTVACASQEGQRTQCAADTSAGVVLVKSTGTAACLLGKTWGYDQTSIWVSEGCSGEFATGPTTATRAATVPPPRHVPNVGFLVFDGDKGQIYLRFFTYAR